MSSDPRLKKLPYCTVWASKNNFSMLDEKNKTQNIKNIANSKSAFTSQQAPMLTNFVY